MAVTVSLRRPYANSIYSIFPVWMELNALEKSQNKCCLEIFSTYSFTNQVDRIYDIVDQFLKNPS